MLLAWISILLSKLLTGTIIKLNSVCSKGSIEPHLLQKLYVWCDAGNLYFLINSWSDFQLNFAFDENKLATWTKPIPLRQYLQWHKKKFSKLPLISNWIELQRHEPLNDIFSRLNYKFILE